MSGAGKSRTDVVCLRNRVARLSDGTMPTYKGDRMAKSAKRAGARSAKSAKKSAKGARSAKSARSAQRVKSVKRAGGTSPKRAKSARKAPARRANAAFMAPVTPSPALAEVVGDKPIPRTEVTKRLWAYIKKKGLQDTQNRRMIKADPTLKKVFGGKSSVNMFEMTKLVGKHLD
jgi:upstream activation factor subunit UAF30